MFNVTDTAKEKLRQTLESEASEADMAVRLLPSKSESGKFGIALDKEKDGDQVIEDQNGKKILLVETELASSLEDVTFDYMTAPEKEGFIMRKLPDV